MKLNLLPLFFAFCLAVSGASENGTVENIIVKAEGGKDVEQCGSMELPCETVVFALKKCAAPRKEGDSGRRVLLSCRSEGAPVHLTYGEGYVDIGEHSPCIGLASESGCRASMVSDYLTKPDGWIFMTVNKNFTIDRLSIGVGFKGGGERQSIITVQQGHLELNNVHFTGITNITALRVVGYATAGMNGGEVHDITGSVSSFSMHGWSGLTLERSKFFNNSNLAKNGELSRRSLISAMDASDLYIRNCRFTNNTGSVRGGVLEVLGGASVQSQNSTWIENTAQDGGAVYASSAGRISFKGDYMIKNVADEYGGAIAIKNWCAQADISGLVCRENAAMSASGGCLYVFYTGDNEKCRFRARLKCIECSFIDNFSLEAGGGLAAETNPRATRMVDRVKLDLRQNTFIGNTAIGNGGGLFLQGFTLAVDIEGGTFVRNRAVVGVILHNGQGGALLGRFLELRVFGTDEDPVVFQLNEADSGGGVFLENTQKASILNSMFIHNRAENNGGGMFLRMKRKAGDDKIVVGTTRFSRNQAVQGGAAHVEDSDWTYFTNITATHNEASRGGAISASFSKIAFSGYIFGNKALSTVLCRSFIQGVPCSKGLGGAFYAESSHFRFSGNDGEPTVLRLNKADFGGAVFSRSSNFRCNAEHDYEKLCLIVSNNQALIAGGGFTIDGDTICWADMILILHMNVTGNVAAFAGGGVFYIDADPNRNNPRCRIHEFDYIFRERGSNVVVDGYGNECASITAKVMVNGTLGGRLADELLLKGSGYDAFGNAVVPFDGIEGRIVVTSSPDLVLIPKRESYTFWFATFPLMFPGGVSESYRLSAYMGRLQTHSNFTHIEVNVETSILDMTKYSKSQKAKVALDRLCPAGTQLTSVSDRRTYYACEVCPIGMYNRQGRETTCQKCPSGSRPDCTNDMLCGSCRPCQEGYAAESGGFCYLCPDRTRPRQNGGACGCVQGYYGTGFNITKRVVECEICPRGAVCDGSIAEVKRGFWAHPSYPSHVYDCKGTIDCIGGKLGESCHPNTMGALCSTCKPGFVRLTSDECSKCPSQLMSSLALTFLLAFCGGTLFFTFLMGLLKAQHFTAIRLLMFFILSFSSLGRFSISWPVYLDVPMTFFNIVSTFPGNVAVCMSHQWVNGEEYQYYLLVIAPAAIATSTATISCLPQLISWCMQCKKGSCTTATRVELDATISKVIRNVVWISLIFYPTIASRSGSIFFCREFPSGRYLASNLSEDCDSISVFAQTLGSIFVLVYSVGFPAFLIFSIRLGSSSKRIRNRFLMILIEGTSFLRSDLRKGATYLEILLLFVRVALNLIPAAFTDSPTSAYILLVFILGMLVCYVGALKPYPRRLLNHIASRSALLLFVYALLGLQGLSGLDMDQEYIATMSTVIFTMVAIATTLVVFSWTRQKLPSGTDYVISKLESIVYGRGSNGNNGNIHVEENASVLMNGDGFVQTHGNSAIKMMYRPVTLGSPVVDWSRSASARNSKNATSSAKTEELASLGSDVDDGETDNEWVSGYSDSSRI